MIETAIVSVTIIIYIPSTQACRRKSGDKLSENVAPPVELTDAEKHQNEYLHLHLPDISDRQTKSYWNFFELAQ